MKKNLISAKTWVAPGMVYLLVVLLTYGAASVQGAQEYGGRYLAKLFVDLAESHALVACLLAGTALFAAVAGLFVLCGRKERRPVWLSTVLALTLPVAVYSQSYGSLTGALTVVPVAALVLVYLALLETEKKPAIYIVFMPVLGLAAALFHEALSLGLCLLSIGLTAKYWKRSWTLLLHSVAACAGCVLVMVTSCEAPLFTVSGLLNRAEAVVDGVLAKNWPLLAILTTACLLLIQPLRAERSKRCNRILRALLLPVTVFAVSPYLTTVPLFAAVLKILAAAIYVVGLWNTIRVYVSRESRRHRMYRLLVAVGAFSLPMLVVGERNDGLLYVPCLLMAAVAVLLWSCALHHYGKLETFCRKLLPKVGIVILCCCVWISVCNGMTDDVRREYTRKQESTGATEICLPEYPFAEYRAEVPVDTAIPVEECAWEDWDWSSYYAERRSTDAQEEDVEETKIIPTVQSDEE